MKYTVSALPWKSDWNATCPFSEDICLDRRLGISMDTGHLNSHQLLGVNTDRHQETVNFRKVTRCGPLSLRRHIHEVDPKTIAHYRPDISLTSQDEYLALDYGESNGPYYPRTWLGRRSKFNNTSYYTLEYVHYTQGSASILTTSPIRATLVAPLNIRASYRYLRFRLPMRM